MSIDAQLASFVQAAREAESLDQLKGIERDARAEFNGSTSADSVASSTVIKECFRRAEQIVKELAKP